MGVTKRKEGRGQFGVIWRVMINGNPSPFTVEKAPPPKYRETQMWDVCCDADDTFLFDARSLDGALQIIETIVAAAQSEGDSRAA